MCIRDRVGTLGVHAAYVDYRACWFPHYRRPAAGVNFKFLSLIHILKENEDYISSLLKFCEKHRVGRLIQISSISSYPNSALSLIHI